MSQYTPLIVKRFLLKEPILCLKSILASMTRM